MSDNNRSQNPGMTDYMKLFSKDRKPKPQSNRSGTSSRKENSGADLRAKVSQSPTRFQYFDTANKYYLKSKISPTNSASRGQVLNSSSPLQKDYLSKYPRNLSANLE